MILREYEYGPNNRLRPYAWAKLLRLAVKEEGPRPRTDSIGRRMSELAERFHVLNRLPGVRPWDPVTLAEVVFLRGAATSVEHAASFVLKVYNNQFPCPPFNLIAAMASWDCDNQAAFLSWAEAPWWP